MVALVHTTLQYNSIGWESGRETQRQDDVGTQGARSLTQVGQIVDEVRTKLSLLLNQSNTKLF